MPIQYDSMNSSVVKSTKQFFIFFHYYYRVDVKAQYLCNILQRQQIGTAPAPAPAPAAAILTAEGEMVKPKQDYI